MKTKGKRLVITIALVFGGVVLFFIGAFLSNPQAAVIADGEQVKSAALDAETGPNRAAQGDYGVIQTVNGVAVGLTYAKRIDTGVEIGFCYDTPDGGDWYPGPGALQYGLHAVLPDEAGFTSETKADGKHPGSRCGFVRYRIDDLPEQVDSVVFVMKDIHAIPREMPACENLQERVRTNPQAVEIGLSVECVETGEQSFSAQVKGGGSGSLPAEAAQDVLDEIVSGVVSGPWTFSIEDDLF